MDGVRKAEGGGEGATGEIAWVPFGVGRSADGLHRPQGPLGRLRELRCAGWRENTQQGTLATGVARVCGDLRLSGGWVGRRCRQAGSGMARSRAKARLNFSAQGQRSGRCRVNRRAERVSRPAREKNRRRRVLVVAIRSPRPIRAGPAGQVVGHRLDGQPGAVGGEAARGDGSARRRRSLGSRPAMVSLQFEQLPVPVGDEAVIAVFGASWDRASASPAGR